MVTGMHLNYWVLILHRTGHVTQNQPPTRVHPGSSCSLYGPLCCSGVDLHFMGSSSTRHVNNFHHKVKEPYKRVRSALRMGSGPPRLPWGLTTWAVVTTCTDGVGSWGNQVQIWTGFRRSIVLLGQCRWSPVRGGKKRGVGRGASCRSGLPGLASPHPRAGDVTFIKACLCQHLSQPGNATGGMHGDGERKLNSHQKHRK